MSFDRGRVHGWLVALLLAGTSPAWSDDVAALKVENLGVGNIDPSSVLAYSSVEVGADLDPRAVASDVKAMEKSGRFAFVAVKIESTPEGAVVIYQVRPKPRLRRIVVSGSDFLSRAKIRSMLDVEPGDVVDDMVLAKKTRKVIDHYHKKHFPYAKISWNIVEDETAADAVVELLVEEGDRAKIGKVSFTGNETVPSGELRKAMKQRKSNLFSFITKAGTYDPDALELDLYALRRIYLDKGYLDASIGRPVLTALGKKRIEISVPIDEGQPYTIGKYSIEGIKLFPEEDVGRTLMFADGSPASVSAIAKSAQALRDYYGSRGYLRTTVRDRVDANPVTRKVDVSYEVDEGSLAYIRHINIQGNTRTKDKVARRELAVYPGDVFNSIKVRRSEQRLRNLGFFSTVFSSPQETGDPDLYDLNFDLEEKKTGQFVVGAGFSSIDNLIGFIELSQGNFDIKGWPNFTGAGQKLKLRAQLGTSRTDLEVSFTEPWFLDRRLSLSVAFFQNDRRFLSDDYNQRNTGGSVSLGKALGGFTRGLLRYRLETIDVYDVAENASEIIQQEEGVRTKSSLALVLTRDSRDNFFIPTKGNRSVGTATLAGGPLGAQTDTYTLEGRTSQFWSLWFRHVLSFRGWIGFAEPYGNSDHVPLFDRFFLGGARSLRGFDYRDVGPRDENGEPVGGDSVWFTSVEYTVPVVKILRAALFYDMGMVTDESFTVEVQDYNSDWGVGIRLDMPQFPLRLDYAWPIEADEFNDRSSGRFNFLLGYNF